MDWTALIIGLCAGIPTVGGFAILLIQLWRRVRRGEISPDQALDIALAQLTEAQDEGRQLADVLVEVRGKAHIMPADVQRIWVTSMSVGEALRRIDDLAAARQTAEEVGK